MVRLKGGDPFVFGRGGEEALALQAAGVPWEVVPGVTAGTAALAYAGIPATHRSAATAVSFITGHEDPAKPAAELNWPAIAGMHGTLVFYMGVRQLDGIVHELLRNGRSADTPAAVVRCGTLPTQQTVCATLAELPERVRAAGIAPPALIVVGDVVRLRDELAWFERRPLFGQRIVVTRARAQASELAETLQQLGAEVLAFPTIRIIPPADYAELDAALGRLAGYDTVVFTSANAVPVFFERLAARQADARALAGVQVCAIGPATAAQLRGFGVQADLQPAEYIAEAIVDELSRQGLAGSRILLPRADIARQALCTGLRAHGAQVDEIAVYQTVLDDADDAVSARVQRGDFDLITFTSSSTVTNFVRRVGADQLDRVLAHARTACIGPVTARTARECRIRVDLMPADYTIPALVDEIVRHCAQPQRDARSRA